LRRFEMLIDGRPAGARDAMPSVDPATEQDFASVPVAGRAEVDRAVRAARRSFPAWAATPFAERAAILNRVAAAILARAGELALLETEDMGKPIHDSLEYDVPDAAAAFSYFAAVAGEIGGENILGTSQFHNYTERAPVGVVASITAWNFPLVNAAWKLAPALAMGNTVVFKPSELTPLTALRLGGILNECGLPPGVANIVTGPGATTGAYLASHPGVDKISFTGSTATGRKLLRASAPKILPCTLELGGKSANIVFPDADLDAAVAGSLFAIFFNAGQVCTAGSRLLLHRDIYRQFSERFLEASAKIKIGPGRDPETRLGPLVSAGQRKRVRSYVRGGSRAGARVVYQAEVPPGPGYFVGPTVFEGVRPDMRIAREEIFGPVLCIFPFGSEDEAVEIANASSYGLAAGLWTRDLARAHRVARRLDAGTVWVNTYNAVTTQMPMPARKHSGIGVELGRQGLEAYTHLKNVVVNLEQDPLDYYGTSR
jgi:acyl-CoA reductase-like NAD-dependent aldehyde dehydrogenase